MTKQEKQVRNVDLIVLADFAALNENQLKFIEKKLVKLGYKHVVLPIKNWSNRWGILESWKCEQTDTKFTVRLCTIEKDLFDKKTVRIIYFNAKEKKYNLLYVCKLRKDLYL